MDVEVACDQIEVVDVQKGQLVGNGMWGWGERPGLGVGNPATRKIRAETTSWREKVQRYEVVRLWGKKQKHRESMQKLLGQIAGPSAPRNRGSKRFKTTKTRKKLFGRWGVLQ